MSLYTVVRDIVFIILLINICVLLNDLLDCLCPKRCDTTPTCCTTNVTNVQTAAAPPTLLAAQTARVGSWARKTRDRAMQWRKP